MRIDQWLWAVRVYRSRNIAADAIKAGAVRVEGGTVKPAREIHPGEVVTAQVGPRIRTLRMIASPPSRVGAKIVAEYAEEITAEDGHDKVPPAPVLRDSEAHEESCSQLDDENL